MSNIQKSLPGSSNKAMIIFLVFYLLIGNITIVYSIYTPEETFNHIMFFTFSTLAVLISVIIIISIEPLHKHKQILYGFFINCLYASYLFNFFDRQGLISVSIMVIFVIMLAFNQSFWGVIALCLQSTIINLYYLSLVKEHTVVITNSTYMVNIAVTIFIGITVCILLSYDYHYKKDWTEKFHLIEDELRMIREMNQKLSFSEVELNRQCKELSQQNTKMNTLTHKYSTLMQNTSDGIIEYELEDKSYRFSKKACQIMQLDFETTNDWSQVITNMSEDDQISFANLWSRLIDCITVSETFYLKYSRTDSTYIHLQFTFYRYDPDNKHEDFIIVLVNDITDQIKATERINYLSLNDYITDLPNRDFFLEMSKDFIEDAKGPVYNIVIDLSGFRFFNHNKGFDNGNRILRHIGDAIKNTFHQSVVSRIYGNTFAIITYCEDTPDEMVDQIKTTIEQIAIMNFDTFDLKSTVQITQIDPALNKTPEQWLTITEKALYEAKSQ